MAAALDSQTGNLLRRAATGEKEAFDSLLPLIYGELRVQARRALSKVGRPGDVSTTVLVNEAYLKLVGSAEVDWTCRAQFLSYAARTMRSILVDTARRLSAQKRTDAGQDMSIGEYGVLSPADLVALDAALTRLRQVDERLGDVIEMRFFAGMTSAEIGAVLAITPRTVERDFAKARILLAADSASTADA